METKTVIYKQLGKYCITSLENYNAKIQDSLYIIHLTDFTSAREVMDFCEKYFLMVDDDFIIIDD